MMMVVMMMLLLQLSSVFGAPCSVLDDPVEVATLSATGLYSIARKPLTCATPGVECSTSTFDGRCRVVSVPSDRGLQLFCNDGIDVHGLISLPALTTINTTSDAYGCFSVDGCNVERIFFPRLKSVTAG